MKKKIDVRQKQKQKQKCNFHITIIIFSKQYIIMYNTLFTVIIVIMLVVTETAAQYFLKQSTMPNHFSKYYISALLFVVVAYLYRLTIMHIGNLAVSNVIWQISTIILVTIMSVVVFKETLSIYQYLGLFFSMMGLLFISL